MRKRLWMCILGALTTVNAFAQTNTLPTEDLQRLGVSAQTVAGMKTVHTLTPKANPEHPGLAMEKVAFANAGGNRSLWRLDFAGDFLVDNSNIIFYIDTDNNTATGRQNYKGIDLMVWVENGTTRTSFYDAGGTIKDGPNAFAAVSGKHLYMSVDIDLHQSGNETVVPVQIVSQTSNPLKSQSATPFFNLRGAPATSTPAPPRVVPVIKNQNVVFTWGLPQLRAIHADKDNIVLPITEVKLKGWNLQATEYRENSAIISSGKGIIQATVPKAGRYYPAFIYYDDTPNAAIEILINGKRQGIATTNDNDNNQKLFALDKPIDLKEGDIFELRTMNNNGKYRMEDLLLLKTLFSQKANQYAFNYVDAQQPWQQPEVVRVTFTSTWPANAVVQYGTTEKLGQEAREASIPVPINNHRIYLRGLKEGQKYFYRLAADDRNGKRVLSPVKSFVFEKPKYPAAIATTQNVDFTLSKMPTGSSWPVNSGVPLPKGHVFQVENIRLVNPSNQPLAPQKRVLSRWTDGSIKWLLLSFQSPASQTKYRLQYGASVREVIAGHLGVQTANDVTVDTGLVRWSAVRQPAGGYRIAMQQGGRNLLTNGQLVLTTADGKQFTSDFKPDEIVLEENGTQRAVVLMKGAFGNNSDKFFRYDVRWHFQRNSSIARVQISVGNDRSQPVMSEIKSAALRFNLPAANGQVQLGELGKFAAAPNQPLSVLQHFDNQFQAQTPQGAKTGERFPGWIEWSNGTQNLAVAVRDFWQLYPKAFTVSGNVLEIGLAPAVEAQQYERFKGTVEEYRSVYYLMNGNYKLRQGTSFTTEVAFNAASQVSGANLASYANEQPILMASPEYYRDSKAFGDIGLGNEFPLVQRYNEKTASAFENYIDARDKQHEYGLMNYGDWWGERGINWGNIEYDTQHAFFLQFARTGDINFLRAGADAAIHNRDIDTVHYDVNKPEDHFSIGGGGHPGSAAAKGRVWSHSIGHTGGYFAQSPVQGQGSPAGGFSSSHTWTEGHYEHYFLTGDTRSLEVANNISDVYDIYATINYDFSNCRVPGWTLIFTMGAYDATGDPFYLNAARIIVDRVLERQTPDGGWRRMLVPGHCTHKPNHFGNAGFMVGVLMTGLKNYAEVTGDQRAKDSVVKASHYMINDMWIPEAKAFRYTSCPSSSIAPGLNLLIAEGIAYAWRQTKDPELRRVALDAMEVIVERMDGKGKNISMELRSTARQLFDISEMLKIQDPLRAEIKATMPPAGGGGGVKLVAEASTLKGKIEKYSWDMGDGSTAQGREVTHTYANGGNYLVKLVVENSDGDKITRSLKVHIPPAFLQNLKPGDLVLQAEDFSGQGVGQVSVVEGRINAVGKAITMWDATLNHWLEWKFEVPQDANYEVIVKYASGADTAHRSVQIDGKYPDVASEKVLFPGTGGFSAGSDDWRLWKLLNKDQKPLQVRLARGSHTIRMTNLGGGMALDFIMIQKVGGA
jgi:hypothetical protein